MHEQLLTKIALNTDIGIIVLNSEKTIVLWNKWIEKTSRRASTETIGKSLSKVFPETIGSRLDQAISGAINSGNSALLSSAWNLHTLPLFKTESTDTRLMQSLMIKPISFDGESYCLLEVFDVTNSNNREALLREKTSESVHALNAAETASKTKTEYVSTVSHELRTPLTSITGALGLILGGVVGEIPEKARGLIEVANYNTTRLLSIINDLLDIEKIEAGKMEFIFSQVDLNQLCSQVVEHNQNYAQSHNVRFECHLNKRPMLVSADTHRISQVLANLLSNAAKFSFADHAVTVTLNEIANKHCRVAIQNHGNGIPESYQETLFEKFTQVQGNQSASKGSGLGLNICRAIINKHDGNIGFHSILHDTTTFFFDLKLVDSAN
ncbi:MAG: ATP-binding protein [Gammaproteobacteria bacterium]|nr:ATP-binding protein [Gammaproteobacteria bacterium]